MYLCRNLFSSKLLPNSRTLNLNIPIPIPNHRIRHLFQLLIHLRHLPPNKPLHTKKRILRIHHRLPLRYMPYQPVPVLRVRHHRRRRPLPLRVRHYHRLPSLHRSHGGVRRS
ncbi:putative glutamate dehydrogenase, NAD-specific [Helianthus anomalus]